MNKIWFFSPEKSTLKKNMKKVIIIVNTFNVIIFIHPAHIVFCKMLTIITFIHDKRMKTYHIQTRNYDTFE